MCRPEIPTLEHSWHDFKKFCFERQFHSGAYYRGQSDAEWGLQPSYCRYDNQPDIDKYFKTILPSAARHISGYVNYDFDLNDYKDKCRLLGLLQHHGFPTPLLDWSRSPYIAAYFAFFDYAFREPNCDSVAIWLLNGEFVSDFLSEKDGSCPFDIVEPDARFNQRLLAQDGLFTLSATTENLEISLAGAMQRHNHPGLLQKIIIPVEFAKIALKDLHLMGLHPGMLFPGIDGACKSLMIKHFVPSEMELGKSNREFIDSSIKRLETKRKM